jgi:alpha-1,2-mannosyltransferase
MAGQDYWLNRRRLLVCSFVFIGFYLVALFAWLLVDVWWAATPVAKLQNDFAGFWSVGHMVLDGRAGEAYDPAAALAVQAAHFPAQEVRLPWFYPPQLFFVFAPLAELPYLPAFFLWTGACLLALAGALRALAPETPAVWLLLASPGLYWILRFGQTGVLVAALLGGALYLLARRRPLGAGALIGLLAFKPHLGLLIPFALIAGRQWRAFAAAALTALALAGACALAFGPDIWLRFLEAIKVAVAWQGRGALPHEQLVSLYALLRVLGLSEGAALALQAGLALGVLTVVLGVWRRMGATLLSGALLAAGSLLVSHHVLGYDLVLLAPAMAILAADGLARGWLPGEREALIALWLWPLFSGVVAELSGVPVGVAGSLLLFALVARRCGVVAGERAPGPAPEAGSPPLAVTLARPHG